MGALKHLVRKEFRQILRDHTMLRMIFLMPLIQLFIFAYAANTDLRNVTVSFLDQDRSAESRGLIDAYLQSDVFTEGPAARTPEELRAHLDDERAKVTVWIPKGFSESLATGVPGPVGITVDGQNSSVAGRAAGYAQSIAGQEGARLFERKGDVPSVGVSSGTSGVTAATEPMAWGPASANPGPAATFGVPMVRSVTRFFYNPELQSRFFMVPGILVLLITVISALLTGMAVVREKEIGTLEQLLVSPLRPIEIVAGKTIPFLLIGYFELIFAGTIAVLWFDLPLEGSILVLGISALAFLLVTLGVGLLASTLSQTQQQAMLTVWFFLVFGILMGGFFYPIENMPVWAQWISAADPLRYIMTIVRGIFLKGAGFTDLWREIAILTGMGVLVFGAAAQRFQKRLS